VTDLIPDDEGFTELVDPSVPRVDLVDRPANGAAGWLLRKQDASAGLLDPDYIRDLLGKSESTDDSRETVTMSGSPGAIAKLIHEASLRRGATEHVAKAEKPAKDTGVAKMVGGDPDDGVDGMDPTVVLAEPDDDMDAPGDVNEPGSPAWEAIDAATAQKWLSIAYRVNNALGVMAEREFLEAASADPGDADDAFDLQDAQCAMEYVIGILATFAADEQAEAILGAEAMDAVGKALASADGPVGTIEALASVRKAGRSLSAANEQAIRDAVSSLQKVLASLPAPVEKTANEESDMPQPATSDEATRASGQEPAMGSKEPDAKPEAGIPVSEVGKADGDSKAEVVVVYDQKGRLVGIVDPGDITPVANADAEPDDMDSTDSDDTDDSTDDSSDDTQTTDLTPQPADQAGTPADAPSDDEDGDGITKSTDPTETPSEMFKSSLLAAVEDALVRHGAGQTEQITKTGDAVIELAELVETLKSRIGALEEQPADPRVFTNGAVPPAHQLRGQDRGAPPIDIAKARELKNELYRGADAGGQNKAAIDLQTLAIAKLQEIHQRRP
jgi:hypothetical protein